MKSIVVLSAALFLSWRTEALTCRSLLKGVVNGSTWNFDNELRCPENTKWCVTVYGKFYSNEFVIDGVFGNCEGSGLLGPLITPLPDNLKCQETGCTYVEVLNATRCCCDSELCNAPPPGYPSAVRASPQAIHLSFLFFFLFLCQCERMPDDIPKIPRHRGKKNRPKDSAWRQQTLPSVRAHVDVVSAIPCLLVGGVALLAVGIALYFGHNSSFEEEITYTNCALENGTSAHDVIKTDLPDGTFQCSYTIQLDKDYEGDVKFYYGLTNYYQNNRLYFTSRNDIQLTGKLTTVDDCDPLAYEFRNGSKIPIAPCGFIANSMFNDTFQLIYITDAKTNAGVRVPWTARNVLSNTEIKRKFRNPKRVNNQSLCDAFKNTAKPPSWQHPICELGTRDPTEAGLGFENIDFMVWMKPAALPKFRKLYRILERQGDQFKDGLPAGNYTLVINYNYPVDSFGGEKMFVIARESWVGPRNMFLPIIYLVVGTAMLLLTALFILIYLKQRFSRVHP
ncbi:unnamed protein product [Caenorhabditis auriculariae]|uniref:Cell cycle control protein 50A n=1 Tax=Caenorhabditis auriculariae TaxID=2777116 RepID=A0A8S1HD37_9PELO|nr:unnamed protein product [Caenorhabditis auriculariae]